MLCYLNPAMVKTADRLIFGSKDTGPDLVFIGIGDQVPTSAKLTTRTWLAAFHLHR